jgi:anti-anti-sigma factor
MDITTMADDVGVRRISIGGRIVQSALSEQSAALDRFLNVGESPRPLLLDLAEADYIDSSGLSWLLVWHKRYSCAHTKLVLHSIPPMVFDVLRTMRLDQVFNIADDEQSARGMLEGAAA